MTFEQIVLLYLYTYKRVSLNLFGTLALDSTIPENEIIKKEKIIPVTGLTFVFDPQVKTDEEFIDFYASEKGRILTLSESDIEFQLIMAKQLVNIGNPFEIPGIGKIVKINNGTLTIIPGHYIIPPESGSGRPAPLRDRISPTVANKKSERGDSPVKFSKLKIGNMLAIGAVLAGVAVIIWAFIGLVLPLFGDKENSDSVVALPTHDTTPIIPMAVRPTQDTNATPQPSLPFSTDSTTVYNWKAYISKTNQKDFADQRLSRYKSYGHSVLLESPDSNTFLIYIPLSSSIKDTATKRDSLAKFFAYPVRLEKN